MANENRQLTGYVLFIRQGVGPPSVITIDVDRKSTLSERRLTWVCRVSVRLLKPGKDGVAEDAAEIERLGDLAGAMFEGFKNVGGEWVAMVTSDGARSWILYAAENIGIEEIVRGVFAGQLDYTPVVEVQADPEWSVYLSFYPSEAEEREVRFRLMAETAFKRAWAMTPQVVKRLQEQGDKLEPRKIDFVFLFAAAEGRALFAEHVAGQKFIVEQMPDAAEYKGQTIYRISISRVERPAVPRMLQLE